MAELLSAIAGGFVGAVIGPILLGKYQAWEREREWKRPRKNLLKTMLDDPKYRFKSLEKLSLTIGASPEDTRTLLIEIGARGAKLKKSKKEGWALITRAPLAEELRALENEAIEEDQI